MSQRTNQVAWIFAATLAAAVLLLAVRHLAGVVNHHFTTDCADMPPLRVFENVFGHPPPPGLWDIRAAGCIYLGGRDVFLRCSATDDAIRSLTSGSKPAVGPKNIEQCIESTRMELTIPHDPRLARWKQRAHWHEIERIAKPECYELPPPRQSVSPTLTLIVDRSRHLVYVCFTDI
jgi:hypothetical protein